MNISIKLGVTDVGRTGMYSPSELDDLLNAWRAARQEAAEAYDAWSRGAREGRRMDYAVFLAATDREEAAERTALRAIGFKG